MKCPKCSDPDLKPVQIEGVALDRCPACCGIWLDLGELQRLLGADQSKIEEIGTCGADPKIRSKQAMCPRCGAKTPMKRLPCVRKRSVVADVCGKCSGVWLDGGELAELREDPSLKYVRDLFYT